MASITKSEVKPRKLEGYQNYHGNRGSSIKTGCGFYVKEGIKFKHIMNSNLLGLKALMVRNQTWSLVFTTGTIKIVYK